MTIQLHTQIKENKLLIIRLAGRLDSLTSTQIEAELLQHLEQSSLPLLLDLQALDYIASAGLRIILMVAKRAKSQELPFALCGLQPQVHHIFEISGFLNIMDVYTDESQAISALQ